MRWLRLLIVALVMGTIAIVGVTMWQLVSAPTPVPHVRVVKVPVPGPHETVVNRYIPVPAPAARPTRAPVPFVTTTTTQSSPRRASAPSHQSPVPAPRGAPPAACVSVRIVGTACLP